MVLRRYGLAAAAGLVAGVRSTMRAGLAVLVAVAATALLAAGLLGGAAAGAATTDLACGRPASASSNAASATHAVDCAAVTVWQSGTATPQQLQVDLGSTRPVDHVTVVWGAGFGTSYKVRTSSDGASWHTVVQNQAGHGGTETLALPPGTSTRWIQLYLSQYTGTAGFTVQELQVFGTPGPSPSGRTVPVSTAAELTAALANARPGQTISLAAGSYDGAFYATVSGTPSAPITLTGPGTATLSNTHGGCDPNTPRRITYCGYGLHLNRVSYWRLVGFTVTRASKGIVLDGAAHNVIHAVHVFNTDTEGIRFRTSSSDNVLEDSAVRDTGRGSAAFGEGLYVGSATSDWPQYGENGGTGPDRSDRNRILNNHFGPNLTAEHIDIKEGTVGGAVSGNTFDGRGISGEHFADSWIDVKGNGYTLVGNHGSYSGGTKLVDGYQVHQRLPGAGCGNVFRGNNSDLGGATGYAIDVTDQSGCSARPNVVDSSNTVRNAGKGLTNIPVTRGS
jgi:hypothetical protein